MVEDANKKQTHITRADGTVAKIQRRFWFDPKVNEGDRIAVAMKKPEDPIDKSQLISDLMSILTSMATLIYIISRGN